MTLSTVEQLMEFVARGRAAQAVADAASGKVPAEPAGDGEAYLAWLESIGYLFPRFLPGGRWAAIGPMLYTFSLVVGRVEDTSGVDDRWCYETLTGAVGALDAWDGVGEPDGWHRHPMSGRRRPGGDASREYVA